MYEDEGRARGQDGTGGPAAPLSVDGLILAASLVLLHEARNDRDAPALARLIQGPDGPCARAAPRTSPQLRKAVLSSKP